MVAGTFNEEQIDINKPGLTIIGGQVRIPAEEHAGPSTLEVTNPSAIGFILDANNITIEGFTIVQGSNAIDANAGFSGFHILGNTFHDSGAAVHLQTTLTLARPTTVSDNTFTSGDAGLTGVQQGDDVLIDGAGASNVVISHNHFVNGAEADAAVRVHGTSQSTNIQILDNSFSADAGITVANAANVNISGNRIANPVFTNSLSKAIGLDGGVINSRVAHNIISSSATTNVDGIVVDAVTNANPDSGDSLLSNTIRGMNVGILIDPANHTTVSGNTITFSSADGIEIDDTPGTVGNLIIGVGPPPITVSNTISANTVAQSSGTGIAITGDTGDTVAHNIVNDNQNGGIALTNTSFSTVSANTAEFNVTAGISLTGSINNHVLANAVSFNDTGIDLASNFDSISNNVANQNILYGFQLEPQTQHDTLSGNAANGNLQLGFLDSGSANNSFFSNTADGNQTGFLVEGAGNTLVGNVASLNTLDGMQVINASGELIKANVINDNGRLGLFISDDIEDETASTIIGNTTNHNGSDGINLNNTKAFTVTGNTSLDNLGDGIDVGGSGNTISGNTALGNGLAAGGFDLFDASGTTTQNTWSKNHANTRNPSSLG